MAHIYQLFIEKVLDLPRAGPLYSPSSTSRAGERHSTGEDAGSCWPTLHLDPRNLALAYSTNAVAIPWWLVTREGRGREELPHHRVAGRQDVFPLRRDWTELRKWSKARRWPFKPEWTLMEKIEPPKALRGIGPGNFDHTE